MEIYDKHEKGFIEVWFTNEEQQTYDRNELTELMLGKNKKCKVIFFLSGKENLYQCTENLLINNLNL